MASSLLYKHISADQVARLEQCSNPTTCKGLLTAYLNVVSFEESTLGYILQDLYFYHYNFCKSAGFTSEKTSTLLSIFKEVMEEDLTTNDPQNTLQSSFAKFKELLLAHAVERPPHSVGVFDRDDVDRAYKHAMDSYYRQFRLFKCVFTKQLRVQLTQVLPHGVEEPKLGSATHLQPLSEAIEVNVTVNDSNAAVAESSGAAAAEA